MFTVTYKPLAKEEFRKHATVQQPLLGNSSVGMFPRQQEKPHLWKRYFLCSQNSNGKIRS
jgi:hypothetical protein